MRSIIITGCAVLATMSAPAAAQYYSPPRSHAPAQTYVQTLPPIPQGYDRDEWVRHCDGYRGERSRTREDWRDCEAWRDAYDGDYRGDYGSEYEGSYGDGYRRGYRGGHRGGTTSGGYGYGYGSDGYAYRRGGYGSGYGGSYGGGYSGGYAYGGGYVTTQSGGVVVTIEEQASQRYVPVIREEVIEETYEVVEYETVRERVIEYAPRPHPPRPSKPGKRIKYIKQR